MSSRERVLHVTQFLTPGGLERMVWKLSCELRRQGHQAEVFVYDSIPGPTLQADIEADGIRVHQLQKPAGFSWKTVRLLRRLLREGRFTAVHSHDLGALIYAGLANRGGPRLVRHIHTQHSFIHFRKGSRYPVYERLFCKLADEILVVAPHQVAEYARLGICSRPIPNGVSFAESNPFLTSRELRRQDLLKHVCDKPRETFGPRPPADRLWVLLPGRIQKSKGQDRIFDIARHLSDAELARLHFIFLGTPASPQDLSDLKRKYALSGLQNQSCYLGFTPHPQEWMAAADAVLSLSEFEGFPLVPLEAAGLGVPTLLSQIEPHRPFAPEADLVPLQDTASMAQWLRRHVLQTERDPARDWQARASFRGRHSAERMAESYLQAYRGDV